MPTSGAGFGWGGLFAETFDPYTTAFTSFQKPAPGILRNHSHEYFHGLQETWKHFTAGSTLYNDPYVSESTAEFAASNACVTSYPGDGTTTLDPTKCVSAHTLYLDYYDSGVPSGKSYLKFPENPFQSYPGALFWAYVSAQFAYPLDPTGVQRAKLTNFPSVSPVLYDTKNPLKPIELPLNLRRPDEGMDFLGYLFASLDASGKNPFFCTAKLPASADIEQRIKCALDTYVGRTFEDELLEFHTMLVLKDYKDTDERWRLEWLGDYNDGAPDTAATATRVR